MFKSGQKNLVTKYICRNHRGQVSKLLIIAFKRKKIKEKKQVFWPSWRGVGGKPIRCGDLIFLTPDNFYLGNFQNLGIVAFTL